MPNTSTSVSSPQSKAICRLAGTANAIAALLSVIDLLPDAQQQSTLVTCSSIANDIARDLTALAGGAA